VRFLPKPLQQPRIPIWACGGWSEKKAPFRRGARWDGMIGVPGNEEDRPIEPAEVKEVRAYMQKHRANPDPFDVVVILWSENDGSPEEQHRLEQYQEAGATWWVEDVSHARFATLEAARERLHKGPPGSRK
jgi:hypothetical protein